MTEREKKKEAKEHEKKKNNNNNPRGWRGQAVPEKGRRKMKHMATTGYPLKDFKKRERKESKYAKSIFLSPSFKFKYELFFLEGKTDLNISG